MHLKKYLENQLHDMLVFKWIESQKAGRDLGEESIRDWIKQYAQKYRDEYNKELNRVILKVHEKARKKIHDKFPNYSDEQLLEIETEVIRTFTEIWAIEMSKNEKPKHLDEI